MSLRDLPRRLDRAQRSSQFKAIAIGLILIVAAFVIGTAVVQHFASSGAEPAGQVIDQPAGADSAIADADGSLETKASAPTARDAARVDPLSVSSLGRELGFRDRTLAISVGTLVIAGLAILVVSLGLGLTYLGLMLSAVTIAAPLWYFDQTRSIGQVIAAVLTLTASFTILGRAMHVLLSGSSPVWAIARNVLHEAVRMKISLVFIVILILLLATLPGILDADQPLRYRIQSFLQYGISGAFWTLAIMTLFFSAATVAFEQRDRVIWQTIAKPVRHLDYLVGKWIGVMALNAVLLAVCGSGLFLFTEYLRSTPAQGEVRALVNQDGSGNPTNDRLLLHSQVLVARAARAPEPPDWDMQAIAKSVDAKLDDYIREHGGISRENPEARNALAGFMTEELERLDKAWRSAPPGQGSMPYLFTGLGDAKRAGRPVTIRYKLHAGGDDPTALYKTTFLINSQHEFLEEVALNTTLSLTLKSGAIRDDGTMVVQIINGNIYTGQANKMQLRFDPGDLEVLYVVGGYEMNFFRVMFVLWVKLGFIAAVSIAASTFLSFPVACFLAMLALFAGETAGYLMRALDDSYRLYDGEGNFDLVALIFRITAFPIAWTFQTYSELKPATDLVDGRLVSWGSVGKALLVVGAWSVALLTAGWFIFRRRELATYSGH